jgi:membrane protein required for colicin V production
MTFTMFDIIAIIVIIFFALNGFRKGLIIEIFKLTGIIVGFVIALQYIDKSSLLIHSYFPLDEKIEKALGFIFIFIFTLIIFILFGKFTKFILKIALMGWLDRTGGFLFGGFKGILIASAILSIICVLPDSVLFVKNTKNNSILSPYIQNLSPKIYNTISAIFPESKSFTDKIKELIPDSSMFTDLESKKKNGLLDKINDLSKTNDKEMLKDIKNQFKNLKDNESFNMKKLDEAKDMINKYHEQLSESQNY